MPTWKTLAHQGRQMRLEIRIAAPRERVYAAWADPDKITQWFTDRARGEATPGGTVTWIFDEFGYEMPYEVKDAVPGERFALGGQLPGRPPFLLEITLASEGGETVLTLVNSGFLEGGAWDEEYEGIHSGWALGLRILKEYVERHFGQPKTTLLVMRPAEFTPERLFPFLTTGEGLRAWLASVGELGAAGEPVALRLRDGQSLNGRVLWVTRREVAVFWSEMDAVLELKGFAHPAGRMVAVRLTGWGPAGERVRSLEASLGQALDRLVGVLGPPAAAQ